jgi:hypothetical protein
VTQHDIADHSVCGGGDGVFGLEDAHLFEVDEGLQAVAGGWVLDLIKAGLGEVVLVDEVVEVGLDEFGVGGGAEFFVFS